MLSHRLALASALCLFCGATVSAEDEKGLDPVHRPKRILLLGQGPDGHPWSTHEYMAGLGVLGTILSRVENVQPVVEKITEPWGAGPELIDSADTVVLFLAEGAKWIQQSPERLAAFQRLAERGGGLVVIHWGMGAREAMYIDEFVKLFGGIHGGPDRKYAVVDVRAEPVGKHPILRGIEPFDVRDEFYYRLKFVKGSGKLIPLVRVPIEGEPETVAWAWERAGGGRSFGFSGVHFHSNWELEPYRRLVAQAILWTLDMPIPEDGLPVDVMKKDLALSPRDQ